MAGSQGGMQFRSHGTHALYHRGVSRLHRLRRLGCAFVSSFGTPPSCCGFSVLRSWDSGVRDVLCCRRRLGDRLDCSQAAYQARGAPGLRNRGGRHRFATIFKCRCDMVPMVGFIVDGASGYWRCVLALTRPIRRDPGGVIRTRVVRRSRARRSNAHTRQVSLRKYSLRTRISRGSE